MKNVLDIKREKKLNFILPKEICLPGLAGLKGSEAVVIIHLHYAEGIGQYFAYVSNIPAEIDIIFTTSEESVRRALETYRENTGRQFQVIVKKNRGRDISGLLVACREEVLRHKYVCFIHDKKAKSKDTENDVKVFIRCLWENALGSNPYIRNVLHIFEKYPKVGVLLPPESFSDNYKFAHTNTWDSDYGLMVSLAKKLQLHCDLDPQKKPLSLGTVFWAKTDALRKLFEWGWGYGDFDEEPLPIDGTVSHAIERSFAYVAQDAGYDTGIILTDEFAGERQDAMQDVMTEAFGLLKDVLGITTIGELKRGNRTYRPLLEFSRGFQELYIYGAGAYGQACAKILGASSVHVKGYIVSKKAKDTGMVNHLPVSELSEVFLDDKKGIIVAVNDRYRQEILETIKQKDAGFKNLYCFLSI